MNQIELLRHVADNLEAGRIAGYGLLIDSAPSNSRNATDICWHDGLYTLTPRTHTVNGFIVPAPIDVEPHRDSICYMAHLAARNLTLRHTWIGGQDRLYLNRGLIFATKEAAQQNALAMLGRDPSKGVDGV